MGSVQVGTGRDLRRERLELAARSDLHDPTAGGTRRERLAGLVDAWLSDVWVAAEGPADGVVLAAVGGQARRDAGPAGDLDLVLLHDGRTLDAEAVSALADRVLYPLWDAGLRVDHSVRSVAECRRVAGEDDAAAVGLLDLRPVAGDAGLALRAREVLRADWRRSARGRLGSLLAGFEDRAQRRGEVAHLLEPDLKESRGGLRDVVVLRALVAGWLADVPHTPLRAATDTLLDVRDALHLVTGRTGERLLLADQDDVAALLGLPDADALLARTAAAGRAVAHAVDGTARRARGAASRSVLGGARRSRARLRPVGPDLVDGGGEVALAATARPRTDPALAVRAAAAAACAGLPLSWAAAKHLAGGATLPDPWPPEARRALVDLLGAGRGLVGVWETLDQAGLVTGWLPELEGVRNRPQRNAIHRHTVDRHLVETCVEASRLLAGVARPDLLLLAALLHDVGKLPGAPDHSQVGAPLAARAARRLGLPPADVEVVERLVREHLTLAELATRRDPDDPRTVEALLAAVDGRPDVLDLLRALTEADARAAGPAAWTPWRARLVDELAARARAAVDGGPPPAPAPLTREELAAVHRVRADGPPELTTGRTGGEAWVTVVGAARPGLFAQVAAVLAFHGLSVRSATVRAGEDVVVGTWQVHSTGGLPEVAVLRTTMSRVRAGDPQVADRVRRRDAAWRPRRSETPSPARVTALPGAAARATVVQVLAADRPGLLVRMGEALAALDVDVRSAHVETHAGRAVDVLYLCEPGGGRLSPAHQERAVCALRRAAESGGAPDVP